MTPQDKIAAQVAALPWKSLAHLFRQRVQESAAKPAARGRKNGVWSSLTWGDVGRRVRDLAHGLLAQGLQPGDRVAVFSPTRVEWSLADFAVLIAGGITVPIYASNTVDECVFILENSGAVLAFVDGDVGEKGAAGRLSRLVDAKARVPAVRELFVFDEETLGSQPARSLQSLEQEGRAWGEAHPGELDARIDGVKPSDPACFIYTSGTTGNPKGVVLAHSSFIFECVALNELKLMQPQDSMLLFLPLAHVFGKTAEAAWLGLGFELSFCDNIDKLIDYLAETKPTVLPAVPRIFEKVYAAVIHKAVNTPGVKGKLARWALGEFDKWAQARMDGRTYDSLQLQLAKRLVFSKIAATLRERLGGRIQLCISGSAPLARKIAYFFEFNELLILEAYGLTENCAGATANRPTKNKIGTVGAPFPGTELKLADDGEILLRGPHIMQGYWQNEAATKDALTEDGWLRTGDIGEQDAEGWVRITDRKKDLIKTSGGKYIAPQVLENALKAATPLISQVMIHGDRRNFVSALVSIAEDAGKALLAEKGVPFSTYQAMTEQPCVREALEPVFAELNKTLPSYETVKKFGIVPQDFTVESGDLTPSLKIKRKVVTQKYLAMLDAFYGEKLD